MIRRLRHIGAPNFPLGTDELGRDMLARLIYGGRLSLIIGILPVILAFVIGTSLGLVAGVTAQIVRETLPENAALIDLGQHRLRDIAETEHVFQLAHPKLREEFPPLKSLGNFRQNLPVQLTSFVGRERERETVRAVSEPLRQRQLNKGEPESAIKRLRSPIE